MIFVYSSNRYRFRPMGPTFQALCVLLLTLTACALRPAADGNKQAEALASAAGWQKQWLGTQPFDLLSYVPSAPPRNPRELSIYIEGDGMAWLSIRRVSPDPTPRNPLVLRLALRHPPDRAAAYLARPCQYGNRAYRAPCQPEYWTGRRFGPEVIAASQSAIDRLKERFGAREVVLIGYSGGGAVAALLAAERQDVAGLVTVAGNLDHRAWTSHHRVTPLRRSINPADRWRALAEVRQYHLVGGKDRIVPPLVARAYRDRFPPSKRPPIRIIPDFSHQCCWHTRWPGLLEEARFSGKAESVGEEIVAVGIPVGYKAALAFSARVAKAGWSKTARSASTFLSTSIPAFLSPFIRRL